MGFSIALQNCSRPGTPRLERRAEHRPLGGRFGACIVAPNSDLNLGIVIQLDGATTTAISIDSQPGEHTILYTVTSPTSGLTGSATRTVIISPATQLSEPPANDNPFNAPDNDNASATTAVDAVA